MNTPKYGCKYACAVAQKNRIFECGSVGKLRASICDYCPECGSRASTIRLAYRLENKLLRCEFSDLHIRGRKNNASEKVACRRRPEWVIRKNGKEHHACKVHKTEGVLVRKIPY